MNKAESKIMLYGRVPTLKEDTIRLWIDNVKRSYKRNTLSIHHRSLREVSVYLHNLFAVPFRLIGKHGNEASPACIGN